MLRTRGRTTAHTLIPALLLSLLVPSLAVADCTPSEEEVSLETIVERMVLSELKYAFIGERHGVGPVKRFAVDLANALVDQGLDVGLYVEGFRTDCDPRDPACRHLAGAFNRDAFLALLDHCRAPVHAIDPPTHDGRAAAMAAAIAAGREGVKVVLVGRSHVVHAGNPEATHPIFGGAMLYPDPGDVAEAFPADESVTFDLQSCDGASGAYLLRTGSCGSDFVVAAPFIGRY
ncbi:MAG TPA: hypothetical protein VLT32_01750 [Candidatus Sulfomarinibacteraceae bacterium]|nr:hypothetical protein [Candidatus Sulfomarinibacteraceae bacterium]